MPGYILHLTESKQILEQLGVHDKEWINRFNLGGLLPDTKKKREKVTSHFWNPASMDRLAIAPDLERFLTCYADRLRGAQMLGYLAHLHLDFLFVHRFWEDSWEFQDDHGTAKELAAEIRQVKIFDRSLRVSTTDFFSDNYYYGDYSKMNAYLLDKYQITIPSYIYMDNPVKETEIRDLREVLSALSVLKETGKRGQEKDIRVFDLEKLEIFIRKTAEVFASAIRYDPVSREYYLDLQKKEVLLKKEF